MITARQYGEGKLKIGNPKRGPIGGQRVTAVDPSRPVDMASHPDVEFSNGPGYRCIARRPCPGGFGTAQAGSLRCVAGWAGQVRWAAGTRTFLPAPAAPAAEDQTRAAARKPSSRSALVMADTSAGPAVICRSTAFLPIRPGTAVLPT
jgi:hypothetical protein